MTEETKPEATLDPMAKAIAGGYKEPAAPSREERVAALIAHVEHAHTHNSPMALAMIGELKELLGHVAPE